MGRPGHPLLARADRRDGQSNQTVRVVGGADSWISALTVATPRIIRNNDAVRIARAPARLTATDSAITLAISISSMTTPMRNARQPPAYPVASKRESSPFVQIVDDFRDAVGVARERQCAITFRVGLHGAT